MPRRDLIILPDRLVVGDNGSSCSCHELTLPGGVLISCVGKVGVDESLPYIRLVPLQTIISCDHITLSITFLG